MSSLREWREQAQSGILVPEYVLLLAERRRRYGAARRKARWYNRAKRLNSRASRVGAEGRVNADDLLMLIVSYGSRCAYCGCMLDFDPRHRARMVRIGTFDHVKPLGRGGCGDIGNLVPACGACNLERSKWPDSALGVPAPHRFVLDSFAPARTEGVSSAADVDGATSPTGPESRTESGGERQGRQPPSVKLLPEPP